MKKLICIGDIHGRDVWKRILEKEGEYDRVVFLGDYFDSFYVPGLDQLHNFREICEVPNSVLLLGNHDYHYLPEVGDQGFSGYQSTMATSISYELNLNRDKLQMAYQFGEFVFTHAGISSVFMDIVFGLGEWNESNMVELLNEQFKYKPRTFDFAKYMDPHRLVSPAGNNVEQSPIWIRPKALMKANYDVLRKKVIQVVGHTGQSKVDVNGNSTGGRYYFMDVLDTSQEYMVIEDGERVRISKP